MWQDGEYTVLLVELVKLCPSLVTNVTAPIFYILSCPVAMLVSCISLYDVGDMIRGTEMYPRRLGKKTHCYVLARVLLTIVVSCLQI